MTATDHNKGQNARIRLCAAETSVRVVAGAATVARTHRAIRLEERGYPQCLYLPRADVDDRLLQPSETRTHCPYKGDATYYHIAIGGETLTDAAWSYEQPLDAVADIAGHLAFDHPGLTLHADDA